MLWRARSLHVRWPVYIHLYFTCADLHKFIYTSRALTCYIFTYSSRALTYIYIFMYTSRALT